ncbi:MAG: putative RNA uridine N3 methyltransferase, partial [Candidatus Alkanophagales archaeon]
MGGMHIFSGEPSKMLSILIPSSLTMDTADMKLKTYKVGQVARAASIFCVDEIVIYKDREYDDSRFIERVLRYAETPQYLRKRLFGLEPELRFAGVIPPLRTRHHPTVSK